ncbi:MAG TPA: diacylglycerol kinase family protein [Desulfomonilaceae bacterium]|nr:diacylglycerol kinase family protein [Desulfomonilaceae bacterium]
MNKTILIIANPVAGRAAADRRAHRLWEALKARGLKVELSFTRRAGDACRIAGQVDSHVRAVVVAGGDGTVNEVLNGLQDPSRVPVAVLPSGTANMLAYELRLPYRAEAIAAMIASPLVRRVDMGLVENKRFLLLVSAGFDAMVTEEVSRTRGRALGYRGYVIPIVKTIGKYKKTDLEIAVDGQRVTGGLVIVFSIRNYGGLFEIDAVKGSDSGHFDVCVFHGGTIPAVLRYSVAMVTHRIPQLSDVTFLSGQNVKIESLGEPVPVEVDGDYFGTTPVEINLRPAHVPVIVPPVAGST